VSINSTASRAALRQQIEAILRPVAAAHPAATPEELAAILRAAAHGDHMLWDSTRDRLVRERRYTMGLRVCAQHNACPDAAVPVTLGVATLPLCERHAAQHRGDMMRFNPTVEES
jgi:hypothetical protein